MMASIFDVLGDTKDSTSKSIVGSLFGLSPDLVAQQQAQQALQSSQQTALQYAQMDPMQRAQYAMFQGAAGAAGGLMGAIGPKSAAVQRAEQEAMLRQKMGEMGIRLDNPQGYMQGAKLAMDMGLTDIAAKMGMAGAQLDKEMSSAEKNRREVYSSAGRQLIEAGFTPGTPEFRAKMQEIIQADVTGKAKGQGTTVNLGGVFDKMFTKQQAETEGKAVAERIDKLGSVVANVPQRTRDIDTILKVLPDSFTGFGATQLKDLSKAAKQLGIPISDKASNTEILNALTTRFVLDLGKVFPGSQSNYELQTIQQTQPNALQDPRTIKRLLQQAKQDYRIANEQYKDAQTYKKANQGTFAGYDLATGQAQASQRVILQDEYDVLSAKAANTGRLTPQEAARAKQLEQQLKIGQ